MSDVLEQWRKRRKKRLLERARHDIMNVDKRDRNGRNHAEENGQFVSEAPKPEEVAKPDKAVRQNTRRLIKRTIEAMRSGKYGRMSAHETSEINTYYQGKFADKVGQVCAHHLATSGTILFKNRGYDNYSVVGRTAADVDAPLLYKLLEVLNNGRRE